MVYTKIPRRLKKRLKKLKLNAHSEAYKKYKKMKSKNIRIKSFDKYYKTFVATLKQ